MREREQLAQLPRQVAHAKAHAPAFARILADVDAASITSRAALAKRAGDAQVVASRTAEIGPAFRWPRGHALGRRGARVRLARADLRARRPSRRLLAAGAGAVRGGVQARRSRAQLLFVPLHAGGIDAGNRCARTRLHGVSGRHRADRAAGAGDGRIAAGGLRRHAVVPEDHPREGGRDGRGSPEPRQGARIGRTVSEERVRRVPRPRYCGLSGLCIGRPRLDRLRDGGARRARRRRERARRDRPARHRRSGRARRSG